MRVVLQKGGVRQKMDGFDPAQIKWRKQASQFAIGVPTGFNDPASVFVKRGLMASGHGLWIRAVTKEITLPATPEPYGYARDGTGHYYFSESLAPSYTTLETLLTQAPSGDAKAARAWLTKLLVDWDLGTKTTDAAAELFAAVNANGFIYTDFTAKNVMVDRQSRTCVLIDLDSAIPEAQLPSDATQLAGLGTQFALTYWYPWTSRLDCFTKDAHSRSLILAFCAVWARGCMMLRVGHDPADIVKLLRNARRDDQEPFWAALDGHVKPAFAKYLHLRSGPVTDRLWDRWTTIYRELKSGQAVAWPAIQELARETFLSCKTQNPAGLTLQKFDWKQYSIYLEQFSQWCFDYRGVIDRKGYALRLFVAVGMLGTVYALVAGIGNIKDDDLAHVIAIITLSFIIWTSANVRRARSYSRTLAKGIGLSSWVLGIASAFTISSAWLTWLSPGLLLFNTAAIVCIIVNILLIPFNIINASKFKP